MQALDLVLPTLCWQMLDYAALRTNGEVSGKVKETEVNLRASSKSDVNYTTPMML